VDVARIRKIGGNPDEEADLREELGGEDPGEADEKYLGSAGVGAGLSVGDAAEVAEADLNETKPPPDPSP
jgi:hypothetical protein